MLHIVEVEKGGEGGKEGRREEEGRWGGMGRVGLSKAIGLLPS